MELNLLPPTLQLHLKNMKERIYMKEVMEKAGKHLEDYFIRMKLFPLIYEENTPYIIEKNNNLVVKYDDLIYIYLYEKPDEYSTIIIKITQNDFCIYNNWRPKK